MTTSRKKKRILKKDNERKKAKHDNLDDNLKEQLIKYEKGKKVTHVNFNDEKRIFKRRQQKKKRKV